MRLKKLLLALAVAVVAPLAVHAQVNINTIVGGGSTCPPAVSPCALNVSIGGPAAAAKDSLGNLYILDNYESRVFKLDTAGNLTIFAGDGTSGFNGDNRAANTAQLNGPRSLFIDAHDNIFIADADNGAIREIPKLTGPQYGISMTAGNIYTVAGNVAAGLGFAGDGGAATSAQLQFPDGVWVDAAGDIFVGDKGNHVIREVAAAPGTNYGILMAANDIYTIAGVPNPGALTNAYSGDGGPAKNAKLNNPWGVYGDSNGDIFFADSSNNAVRVVVGTASVTGLTAGLTSGNIYTLAGTPPTGGYTVDGVLATTAELNVPLGVYVDASGNLFISDTKNQIIREVPAATTTTPARTKGFIYTVAGTHGVTPSGGVNGDGGLATSAQLDLPSNVFLDASNNIFIADTQGHNLREVTAATGDINSIVGNAAEFFAGDGGPATNAEFSSPFPSTPAQAIGIATDPTTGNLFIADTDNDLIRQVTGGVIQTIVGGLGNDSFSGDLGPANRGLIANPDGVFVDKAGNMYIADTANNAIREVAGPHPSTSQVTGNIYTIAGFPATGPTAGFSGDGGPATSAKLNAPTSVFVDDLLNVYIADTGNNAIREIAGPTPSAGMVTGNIYLIAGFPTTGPTAGSSGDGGAATSAQLSGPQGVFVDHFGNIFIADTGNQAIREIPFLAGTNYSIPMTTGNIYTVAGMLTKAGYSGDGGAAKSAMLTTPFTVLVDNAGNIFISDAGNHIIREVSATTAKISTVAGTPQTADFSGDGGLATAAELNTPQGLAAGTTGNLLIADSLNLRIRSVGPNLLAAAAPAALLSEATVTFTPAQNVGQTTAAQTVTLTNTGGVALNISGSGVTLTGTNPGDFAFASTNNTCATTTTLAISASCTISVTFTPTAPGARSAKITIADNAGAGQQNVGLSGTGVQGGALLSATTLNFTPAQIVGTASAAQTVTLTNNGTASLTFAISLPGSDFVLAPAAANTCVSPLAISTHCTISVEFTPTQANPRTATISITDNAPASPQTISLSGTGLPTPATATLSGTAIAFGSQLVTTASAASSVTLTNNGTGTLTFAATNPIILTGANPGDFALTPANPCGASLASGAKCTIGVTFTPTASGARTAAVTITDNAGGVTGTQQTINLTGAGLALSFAPAAGGSMTQTVKAGQLATYNLQLSALGGAPTDVISVAVACTGAPSLATCSGPSTPVSVVPGTPAAFAITVKTTGSNAVAPGAQFEPRMQPPSGIRTLPLFVLALLSIAALLSLMQGPAGRMRTLSVTMAACLVLMPISAAMLLQGCGGGSSGGTTPPPVTAVAPTIGTQPANQTVTAGQTASFSVVAAGTAPLTYQWQKGGTAISGATSASYTTPATVDSDNGATFTVVVSNSAGNVTSSAATMTVQFTPSATSNLTVTFTPTLNGKAQPAQTVPLTLIVQ
jgi:hypothetical protein